MASLDAAAAAPRRSAQVSGDGQTPVVGSELYCEKSYWDARFETEDVKEWLCAFDDVRPLLESLVPAGARVLLVGCGNSELGADLVRHMGLTDVVASDFSATCVARMTAKHADLFPKVRYVEADMLDLGACFEDSSFDVVIDKAGFDAVVADGGGDKWTPTEAALERASELSASVGRVLRDGGRFLQITFSQAHFRRPLLLRDGAPWTGCDVHKVDVGFGYVLLSLARARRGG